MEKTIGIIGGMGPLATCELFNRIVNLTDATRDCDHIRIVIDNNTKIPDRTAAINNNGESPVPALIKSGKLLINAGVDFIIIPCNTSHYYLNTIKESLCIEIVDMIGLTASFTKMRGYSRVGVLATSGTVETGIYYRKFNLYEIECIYPEKNSQNIVMDSIYNGVKRGDIDYALNRISPIVDELIMSGVQAIVLGCTELSVINGINSSVELIDPLTLLAKASIVKAGYKLRNGEDLAWI